MRHYGRISLSNDRVEHVPQSNGGYCWICGEPAHHLVKGESAVSPPVWLCTKHLARIFHLPANRFPRKKKVHVKQDNKGGTMFKLRRHMDTPYIFNGQRLACHVVKIFSEKWYFTLYWRDGGSANPMDSVLSVTRIMGSKKFAIHQVEVFDGFNESIIEKLKYLLHVHSGIHEIPHTNEVLLGIEMTKFIEECVYHSKKLTDANQKKADLLMDWRATQAKPTMDTGTVTISAC